MGLEVFPRIHAARMLPMTRDERRAYWAEVVAADPDAERLRGIVSDHLRLWEARQRFARQQRLL
jgi:hypothetical protein